MRRFRPIHGVLVLAVLVLPVVGQDLLPAGWFGSSGVTRVGPDDQGVVRVPVGDLGTNEVRFYRFLNAGNQEVKFFIGRDEAGTVQVAFDANEICFKRKRGYEVNDGWLICRVCEKSFRLSEVNEDRGGCAPVAVAHRLEGDEVVIAESDMLAGWRFFR